MYPSSPNSVRAVADCEVLERDGGDAAELLPQRPREERPAVEAVVGVEELRMGAWKRGTRRMGVGAVSAVGVGAG